jgi:hypothetical protein
MRSGAPGAWKLELVVCRQRAGCGSAEAGPTDKWCHRIGLWIGLRRICPGAGAPNGPPGTAFGELLSYFVKLFCCVLT